MSYNSAATSVTAKTGETYDGSSRPTETQVLQYLSNRSQQINSVLAKVGYDVPADGANDVELLAHYEALAAAVDAESNRLLSATEHARVERWWNEFQQFLKDIRSGEVGLIDQDPPGADEAYFTTAPGLRREYHLMPEEDLEAV